MYLVEDLIPIFIEHSKSLLEGDKKNLKEFLENHPGELIPTDLYDRFDLPMALASMCQELLLIKKRLNGLDQCKRNSSCK